jgi:hypothetical protein
MFIRKSYARHHFKAQYSTVLCCTACMLWAMSEKLLPRIPRRSIARALQTLPPAETAANELMETTIVVPRRSPPRSE